jgi:hypothetical protein
MEKPSPPIHEIPFEIVVCEPYRSGAIERTDFPGFREDYLVLHSLIRRYHPRRFLEIGTSVGYGTNVICNAMGLRAGPLRHFTTSDREVLSIDVPPGTNSKQIYPDESPEDSHPARAGARCRFSYVQLYGDSTTYDYSRHYPLDGWFIDGKHNYEYASKDTLQVLKSDPHLIVWHDMQIDGVSEAVGDIMSRTPYEVSRVAGTRVGYAVRHE